MSISKKIKSTVTDIPAHDTIAAIATSMGESGIGIVRLSGKGALSVAETIFASRDGKKPSRFKTYTVHYGWVRDPQEPSGVIDEVILSVMRAPKSYTREDVVEINCHGGIIALRKTLDLALEAGCRLAEPGEFTKRAFLHGRIDLAQAEAVLDIIRAKSDAALRIGAAQLQGKVSKAIGAIRDLLMDILVPIEAHIDFPEDEIGGIDPEKSIGGLRRINNELKSLLASSGYGRILREGIHVVICGRPNAGKSSLLNALLRQERSIVTAVPGTTRDTIEEIIDIKGIPIRIVDTAGIVEPRDLIEKKAVARARRQIELADLVLLVFDGSQKLTRQDRMLMARLKNKTVLAVVNKIDKKQLIDKKPILAMCPQAVEISAKKSKNIELLEEALSDLVYRGRVSASGSVVVANARHIQLIKKAQKLIAEAVDSMDNKLPPEFVAQGLKDALGFLDELTGKRFSQGIVDRIFSEFCIGK